ncbi:hypothetical protein T439DRAFT_76140 [Meredithblackwellia eburnea MCA 4105]
MFVNSDAPLVEMAEGLELDNDRWQQLVNVGRIAKRQISPTNATKNPRYQLIILRPTVLLAHPDAAFSASESNDQLAALYATSSDGTIRQLVGQFIAPFNFSEGATRPPPLQHFATGPPPLQNFNQLTHRRFSENLDPHVLVINAYEKICSCEDLQVPLPATSSTTITLVRRIIDLLLWRPTNPYTNCQIETQDPKEYFAWLVNELQLEQKAKSERTRTATSP